MEGIEVGTPLSNAGLIVLDHTASTNYESRLHITSGALVNSGTLSPGG